MTKANNQKSIKHALVDKANTQIFVVVSVAVFIAVFCLFAARSLISQSLYQQRVISAQKEALDTLESNKVTAKEVEQSYISFATEPVNIIGGNPAGTGPRDGDNIKLVLDSLPSEYDYPAVSSSIEKIIVEGGYKIVSVGGKEDSSQAVPLEATPVATTDATADATVSVETTDGATGIASEIPFVFTVESNGENILKLLNTLEKSIRPFYIQSISISATQTGLETEVNIKTFFLPPKGLEVIKKAIE